MAQAKFNTGRNKAGRVTQVMADTVMDHDVNRMAFRDKQINGVSQLQLPAFAWFDAAKGIKNRTI